MVFAKPAPKEQILSLKAQSAYNVVKIVFLITKHKLVLRKLQLNLNVL